MEAQLERYGPFKIERLGRKGDDYMTRLHLTPWKWWPFKHRLYLHMFSREDRDVDPHDHPFRFRSFVLWGGFREEVHQKVELPGVEPFYVVTSIRHLPGTTYVAEATHVHRITELYARRVVTLVVRGPKTQDWGFYVREGRGQLRKIIWWEYLRLRRSAQ